MLITYQYTSLLQLDCIIGIPSFSNIIYSAITQCYCFNAKYYLLHCLMSWCNSPLFTAYRITVRYILQCIQSFSLKPLAYLVIAFKLIKLSTFYDKELLKYFLYSFYYVITDYLTSVLLGKFRNCF